MHEHIRLQERPRISPPVALSLQQTAGNAAVARMLAREAAPAPDRAKLTAIEGTLGQIAQRAQGRSDRIGAASDSCIQSLRQSKDHLKAQNTNYRVAHTQFLSVLTRADKSYKDDKDLEDSVQGILVAAALGAIAPEAIALAGAEKLAAKLWWSTNATLEKLGLAAGKAIVRDKQLAEAGSRVMGAAGAGAGEKLEQIGGKGADWAKDGTNVGVGGDKPSETAAGAGPPDKFAEAFGHLDRMLDMLPQFGKSARSQGAMAMASQELAKEALRLSGGGKARFTVEEVEEKAAGLEAEDASATAAAEAIAVEQQIDAMALAIMRKAVREPREIERDLWRAWMASLKDPRVLSNSEIKEYLGPKGFGLVDLGEYFTYPWETRDAAERAQKEWAEETTGARPTAPVPGGSAPAPGPPPAQ
ncbi:hypothetical protein [Solirubrobacter soli]|uniref:hypothetical protein n=1 Tax=Solirubrobacter soli TaxID=363832 RepID=UPI000409E128|nr:hypothetical protein [Solirubrobacter soli]